MATSNRRKLILYTTAVCNLKCRYCYIDKNPALKLIDDILEDSFKDDYYKNFILEMFPDPNQLTGIETWGGEPFLRMDRICKTLEDIIPLYPKFDDLYSSSNVAFDEWNDQFYILMKTLGKFPDRHFNYTLQVSIDGPASITDMQRGEGVTARIFKNIEIMLERAKDELPKNVNLFLTMKSTLDTSSLKYLLTKKSILEYYKTFDDLMDLVISYGYDNIHIQPSLPNFASPPICTVDIGKAFARMTYITRAIEDDISRGITYGLKYHNILTPFDNGKYLPDNQYTMKYNNYTCGTGYTMLGLLPYKKISICHNGFVDLISDYKKLYTENSDRTIDAKLFIQEANTNMIKDVDQYLEFERQMNFYNCPNTSARLNMICAQIILLAHSGMIDEKFKNEMVAREAAIFYQQATSYCIRDNVAISGSKTAVPNGHIKLFFNGAYENIIGRRNF